MHVQAEGNDVVSSRTEQFESSSETELDWRLDRPNYQLRPIGRLEIDPRGHAAGIEAGPGDLGETSIRG